MLLWRTRVSVLWIILAVSWSAHMLLALTMPGMLSDVMEGRVGEMEITGGLLAFFAVFWIVPFLMAFFTLALGDPANRYTNAIVGVLATAVWVWDLVGHLAEGGVLGGIYLLTAITIAAGLAILWHAWKWPKTRDEKPPVEEVTRIPAQTATPR